MCLPGNVRNLLRFGGALLALSISIVLTSCQNDPRPVKVGFIGCLTGRSTDLGVAGRDGFMLAVREINDAGGLSGRPVVPVVADNALDDKMAGEAVQKMLDEKVDFVVGPMTSQMAVSMVPAMNAAKIPLISPTVSTNKLIGIDDYFFRVYYANSQAAEAMAEYIRSSGLERIVALYDTRNLAYTEDWVRIFQKSFTAAGGQVEAVSFSTGNDISFLDVVGSVRALKPDGLLVLANSIDTALICQQAAKLEMAIPKFATGWSYSGKLITYGGRSVEGLVVVQSVDFKKERSEVRHFLDLYRDVYFVDPSFPAAHAYDATRLGLEAMKMPGGELKDNILRVEKFPGILQDFSLDEHGDVVNPPIYFMKVDESVFHSL